MLHNKELRMTRRLDHAQLLLSDEIVTQPVDPLLRACDDHSFELPAGLYAAMAGLFLGFVTILTLAFSGHMAVSYGVIAAFIAAFFTVPTAFAHAGPSAQRRTRALSWSEFMDRGVVTATGRCGGKEATVLVLSLPVLIFGFGAAVATIAALVS
jgi:hypothetical protein